ncbi:acetate--CoA ligase family protein [Chloroflexota bacterium]
MVKDIVRQLDPIFKPKTVAVIGSSNNPFKWGHQILSRIANLGYRGTIYPVNPHEKEILGLRTYPSILDIPDEIDLAIFAVPAAGVPTTMAQCVEKGIKGAVMISGGFAEVGQPGKDLQDEMVRIARTGGIRLVGPNGMGIWSSAVRLVACMFEEAPRPGPIAFVSQSGTFGSYLGRLALAKGYGLSKFISAGNQADLTHADYLEYLGEDPDTGAIVFYMEGLSSGEGRRFFEIALQVIKKKPILLYKAGRSKAAERATMSHTASLAGSDDVFDAMCHQVGIIRTNETVHLFDMAIALCRLPSPKGNRIAILGTGGQGVVTTDSCALLGLEIPELDRETQESLKKMLPPQAPLPTNPVDFAGQLDRSPLQEAKVAEKLASLDYIDGVVMNEPSNIPRSGIDISWARNAIDGAELIASIPGKYGKPVVAMTTQMGGGIIRSILEKSGIPVYSTPEESARAMYALVKYAQTRQEFA